MDLELLLSRGDHTLKEYKLSFLDFAHLTRNDDEILLKRRL